MLCSAFPQCSGADEVALLVSQYHRGRHVRPEVPAEGLGLDRAEDHGHVEDACRLRQGDDVVDDGLTVEVRHAEHHLRLVVDGRHDAVVGRESPFSLSFGRGFA
jgi:hypothetical protein